MVIPEYALWTLRRFHLKAARVYGGALYVSE